jgi:hypothetical protein
MYTLLRGAMRRRAMQSAFLVFGRLPPPAPGTRVFSRLHRARAGRASYAAESAIVQRVVGNVMRADVVPHLFLAPVEKRTNLVDAELGVPTDRLHFAPGHALVPAQAADPRVHRAEHFAQRPQLAHFAAGLALLHAGVEKVRAIDRDQLRDVSGFRREDFIREAVALGRTLHHVVGLLEQASGVEREDAGRGFDPGEHVGQHLVLRSKAGGQRNAPYTELLQREAKRLFRRG